MEQRITELFGSHVLTPQKMRDYLPPQAYRQMLQAMERKGQISLETADMVANAMKEWAISKGATHYTHWFQPLTGVTAEKHDSFLAPAGAHQALLQLTGKQLIMGESDASSFPSGGLRATHYARGYTAWDMTSPAFVKEMSAGMILCIPTIFVSYHGEALDKKTPLLRSMEALEAQALRLLRCLGREDIAKVFPCVGAEQEYFLVDREMYRKRRDLIYTGRTLFGAPAPKGQELDDQYFGVIRDRVGAFMSDLNQELWKLGIPATTQHNEAAPAQHEMAPHYTICNLAVDQNQLAMETMKRVATRHGLVCLFHEKPFAGVNGSGKHNNWSLGTDTGENLLDPGPQPHKNLLFLLLLSCILEAVDLHADLLRQSASCVGNEYRLGGQEAPPAILSVFLGDHLAQLVSQIISHDWSAPWVEEEELDSGVSTVPLLHRDTTDRNRTTPFAFTGNKFEFRMVGSSDSIADANTTLNAIVAQAFSRAADALEGADQLDTACAQLIHDKLAAHQRIIFNGNGYSDAWVQEAARRGLPQLPSLVDAVPALTTPKALELFTQFGIYRPSELEARREIMYETYIKVMKIEANTMIHMAAKSYLPAVISYTTQLAQSITCMEKACPQGDLSVQRKLLLQINDLLSQAYYGLEQLKPLMNRVDAIEGLQEMALAYRRAVVPAMEALRYPIDQLELMVDSSVWPVPTYGDLMFEV